MATGTVKWFNDAKGFGLVAPDDGSDDLFAHYSEIKMSGFKSLKEGQRISFEVTQGPKDLRISPGNNQQPQVDFTELGVPFLFFRLIQQSSKRSAF